MGGLNISEVRSELEKKLQALESIPLVLQVEGILSLRSSLNKLE